MRIIETRVELNDLLTQWRSHDHSVAVAPTMGALHDGHLSLVDAGKRVADRTIATVFVNPLQFAPGEDYDTYPRNIETDAAKLNARGCDALFAPDSRELFAPDFSTKVSVGGVGENHCAIARPLFFDGVATIVTKLLMLLRPDAAVFGEKDFQQLAVIRRMVRDLEIGVKIIGVPTVRENDGLAMSSRNTNLSASERAVAPALYRTIREAASRISHSGARWAEIESWAFDEVLAAGFTSVDYVNFVNAETLEMMNHTGPEGRILGAAQIGDTRLIDNFSVSPAQTV